MAQTDSKFDLEERTAKFGEQIILFSKTVKQDAITKPLIGQIIRSATSIGANYMEANGGSSKKEAQETQHWLRMLNAALPDRKDDLRALWQECHELVLIFQKITSSLKN